MKILLARTDHIGDLILSLPMAGLIKQHIPQAQVFFLARAHAHSIVQNATYVDGCLDWDAFSKKPFSEAANILKKENFDIFINVSTEKKPVQLAKKAGIPKRIGTAHRLHHWLYCNRLVFFSRKFSSLHEMQLNAKLLKPLKIPTQRPLTELLGYLSLQKPALSPELIQYLSSNHFNLILHPGSNGNGREWPIENYVELLNQLPSTLFNILVTGSAQETRLIQPLIKLPTPVIDLTGKTTLSQLQSLIANSDGLIASGTGPLHLAAAAGIHTLGLYPPVKTAGIKRWGPIGKQAEAFGSSQACTQACANQSCPCMRAIQAETVKTKILSWLEKNSYE